MFLLVSLAVCFLGASLQGAEAASCHMREVDLCIATMLLSATDGVPATEEEVDRVCEPIQEGIDCMGNYSHTCFTPLFQEVFDMVMAEPRKYQALMCTAGTEERNRYLKHAPCIQQTMSGENLRPHLDDLMTALEAATESEFQKRIPIMCCGLQRLFKVTTGMVEKECGAEVLNEGGMMIGMSVTSISEAFCRGYDENSSKCQGILPPSGTPNKGSESKLQLIQFLNTALSNLQ